MGRLVATRLICICYCTLLLYLTTEVKVTTGVTQCINRIGLLEEGSLISSVLGTRVTSTSANEQYKPVKAIKSDIGWCSDYSQCSITQDEYIEIDFGAEVVVEAISILQAAGGYVTQYFVEYARSDRVFDCIREQFSNQIIFAGNSVCGLEEETRNFSHPVLAQFVRVTPIQWEGASVCLRMELYGCFVKECPVVATINDDNIDKVMVTSSGRQSKKVLNLQDPWCASHRAPQSATITFTELVYLTQLQVVSTNNEVSFSLYYDSSDVLYSNIGGANEYTLLGTLVMPIFLPVNSTEIKFQILDSDDDPCFAVELTGCLSSQVVSHMEDIDDLPIATQTCRSQVTPAAPSTIGVSSSTSVRVSTCSSSISESTSSNKVAESSISPSSSSSTVQNTPNTVYVTYTHTAVVMSTVQMTMSVVDKQLVTSSDSSDCNTAAIVVPIVVSVITVVVVIVSIVVAAVWWRRSKPEPVIISVKNSHTCVVENDLYKSEEVEQSLNSNHSPPIRYPQHFVRHHGVSNIYDEQQHEHPLEIPEGETIIINPYEYPVNRAVEGAAN
ncbi:uncharacterized protein [Dysidea avara]|uniref:uncharacterized protein n=1 Tax=Dysidea avara TaxID=196820 RepID=UPI003323B0A9